MNRPDRPCRMGPPSYVCWFRNPMNTIVIYVTWSPVVARLWILCTNCGAVAILDRNVVSHCGAVRILCRKWAAVVALWPFWIVTWSFAAAKPQKVANNPSAAMQLQAGKLLPQLHPPPHRLEVTVNRNRNLWMFCETALQSLTWNQHQQVRVDDVDLLSASISQYRWRAQSCELASSRGDGQGDFWSRNLFVISAINHGIQPLITQLNAIDWGPHPVVFSTFLRTPRVARCSTNQLGIDAVKDRESHLLNCTRWLNLV